MTVQDIEKLIRPIKNRIMNMMARAIVKLSDDSTAQVEIHEGEIRDKLDRMQEYGFASRPKEGAEALVVFVGGNRDHGVVVATADKRGRPALEDGEVAMWSSEGVTVRIFKGKKVKIQGAESIELGGDGKRLATWQELQNVLTAMENALKLHTHPVATTGTAAAQTGTAAPSPGLSSLSADITAAKTETLKTGG